MEKLKEIMAKVGKSVVMIVVGVGVILAVNLLASMKIVLSVGGAIVAAAGLGMFIYDLVKKNK